MKKLLSIVLSLCMVLTMMTILSFTANAKETDLAASAGVSNGFEYEIHFSGLACITGYSGSATDMTIPTSLDGHPVDEIKPHAFENCTSLQSVTFPEDRGYRVGEAAFFGCTSLKTVTIPNSVYNIGEYAFGYYDVNSYKKVSEFTIRGYTNSKSQLYAIQNGFSFVSIGTLPAFNYYEYDGNAEISSYSGCDSSVSIPSQIDGYPVTAIGSDSFYHSLLLESVTIPDSVTEIHGYAFAECPSLKSVTIPDSVTTIDYYAFGGCPSLKTVTIPASVESIGDYAFGYTYEYDMETDEENYSKTPGFTIQGYTGSAAQRYAIENGFSFVSIGTAPVFEYEEYDGMIEILSYNGFDSSLSIPSQIDGYPVTSLGSCSFDESPFLESVTIPDSVTEIHNYAFDDCPSLKTVTIPDSVTTIGYDAFAGCPSLKTVTIPASVESIGENAFGYTHDFDEDGYYTYYKIPGFTIQGYNGSAAQEYALYFGFEFVSLGDPPPEVDLGDIDGDGTVSVLDATRIQKYRAMLCNLDGANYDGAQPTASQLLAADTDKDGVVSVLDATRIQKYRARICNLDGSTPYTE